MWRYGLACGFKHCVPKNAAIEFDQGNQHTAATMGTFHEHFPRLHAAVAKLNYFEAEIKVINFKEAKKLLGMLRIFSF
jgi:hypothetical protein